MIRSKLGFLCVLVGAWLAIACGGGDDGGDDSGGGGAASGGSVCEQACAKLEQCSPGSVCTVNSSGSCDGKAADMSQCILDKPCGETQACLMGGI